jgi:hypothetical protein
MSSENKFTFKNISQNKFLTLKIIKLIKTLTIIITIIILSTTNLNLNIAHGINSYNLNKKSKIIKKQILNIKPIKSISINDNNKKDKEEEEENFLFENIKINFSLKKTNGIFDIKDFGIPTDLIEFLPSNENIEIIITQGRLPEKILKNNKIFYEEKKSNRVFSFNILPSGLRIFINKKDSNENFDSNKGNFFSKKKLFFDIFSYIFKISLNPLTDRSNYIEISNGFLFTDNSSEKPCNDHLDGIKNILPLFIKTKYMDFVSYDNFLEADYKSIKINIESNENKDIVKFKFQIIYRIINENYNVNNINNSNSISNSNSNEINKYSQDIEIKTLYYFNSFYILNNNNEKDLKNLQIKFIENNGNNNNNNNNNLINNIYSNRFLIGEIIGFDNFIIKNKIKIITNENKLFSVIDLIPEHLDILFSTITIKINLEGIFSLWQNENKNKILNFYSDFNINIMDKNFKNFFDFSFFYSKEFQNKKVPFTYEDKKSLQLNFKQNEKFLENLFEKFQLKFEDFSQKDFFFIINFEISYELRKRILNFESMENENELGFIIPCGVLMLEDKDNYKENDNDNTNHNDKKNYNLNYNLNLSNHLYFNMPDIDITMPFNIIALSWVLFGFMFIQTLNKFLVVKGEEDKSLLQTLRDRFIAKWGFLFGK